MELTQFTIIFSVLLAFVIAGRHSAVETTCPPYGFSPVAKFDFNKFAGTWYIQSRQVSIMNPSSQAFCETQHWNISTTSNYAYEMRYFSNELIAGGSPIYSNDPYYVDIPNPSSPSKLKMSLYPGDDPLQSASPFWVVYFESAGNHSHYSWVIATAGTPTLLSNGRCSCNGAATADQNVNDIGVGFFLLSRSFNVSQTNLTRIMNIAQNSLGLDTTSLLSVNQNGCTYHQYDSVLNHTHNNISITN